MDEGAGIAAAKQRMRTTLLAARRARGGEELAQARGAVADAVLASAAAGGWRCVTAYEPMRTEPGSTGLLERLVRMGVEVLVPVTRSDLDLDWVRWSPDPGEPVLLGREAIARAQAALVPALAVGRDGSRLGRGGGSYDRALVRCSPGARRIALVFDDEVLNDLPVEPWDVRMDAAITPSGWIGLCDGAQA